MDFDFDEDYRDLPEDKPPIPQTWVASPGWAGADAAGGTVARDLGGDVAREVARDAEADQHADCQLPIHGDQEQRSVSMSSSEPQGSLECAARPECPAAPSSGLEETPLPAPANPMSSDFSGPKVSQPLGCNQASASRSSTAAQRRHEEGSAKVCSITLPAVPNEAAFVATDAAVRRAEYQRLQEWFAAGSGLEERAIQRYEPWLPEILMDKDPEAFAAACHAARAHYAAAECCAGNPTRPKVVPPTSWLLPLGERLREDLSGPAPRPVAGARERAAASELVSATARCLGAGRFWRIFQAEALKGEDVRMVGALQLLSACAEHGAVAEAELRAMLQEFNTCILNSGQDAARRSLEALVTRMPSLREKLPRADDEVGLQRGEKASLPGPVDGLAAHQTSAQTANSSKVSQPGSILQVLSETSMKNWRERLQCLDGLGSMEAELLGGAALWPALVLQCEDEHPAVTSAALHAVARTAARLGSPGDLLVFRLSKAINARLRQGQPRAADAAIVCVRALAHAGVLAFGPLVQFLVQALNCSKEQARAAITEMDGGIVEDADRLHPTLEALMQAAGSSTRKESRRLSATPGSGPGQSPPSRASPAASTPPSRVRAARSASRETDQSGMPAMPHFTPDRESSAPACASRAARTPARTPSRYAHLAASPDQRPRLLTPDNSMMRSPSLAVQEAVQEALASTPPPRSSQPDSASSGGFTSSPATHHLPQDSPFDGLQSLQSAPLHRGSAQRAPASWSRATSSLAGPQLRGESRFMSPSRVLLSNATARGSLLQLPPGPLTTSAGEQVRQADGNAVSSGCSQPRTSSQEASRNLSDRARAADLHAQVDAALRELEGGGNPAAWHEVLRALAAWEVPEGVRDLAESVARMVLEAAPRIPVASRPELWRALTELGGAGWLNESAALELAVGHCLGFTEPRVVGAFLAQRAVEGRLSVAAVLDCCLERLQTHGRGPDGARLAQALLALVQELCGGLPASERLLVAASAGGEQALHSLEGAVEAALSGLLAPSAVPPLRAALEVLVERLPPDCASDSCWQQLWRLLGHQRTRRPTRDHSPRPHDSPLPGQPNVMQASLGTPVPGTGAVAMVSTPSMHRSPVDFCDTTANSMLQQDHSMLQQESQLDAALHEDSAELPAALLRLDRLILDLARAEGEEVAAKLRDMTEVLRRPQWIAPLRAFLRRLLHRQRSRAAAKENTPPLTGASQKPSGARDAFSAEFLDDDYAGVREVYIGDGLAGAFPHSLLGHLKRLLRAPAAAETHRAAVDCLAATATACGPLLLRLLLRHFAGVLLRTAAARGPAQALSRSTLTKLVVLSDPPDLQAAEFKPRWLRLVWRALSQAICNKGASSPDAVLLGEALRWLSDDALRFPGASVGHLESRELLALLAPASQQRGASGASVRAVAARALQRMAIARGGEALLREDLRAHPLISESARASALAGLAHGAPLSPPAIPVQRFSMSPAGPGSRVPSTPASSIHPERLAARSPAGGGMPAYWSAIASRSRVARLGASSERPRRLQFSPSVEETSSPDGTLAHRRRFAPPARDAQQSTHASIDADKAVSPGADRPCGASPEALHARGPAPATASPGPPPPSATPSAKAAGSFLSPPLGTALFISPGAMPLHSVTGSPEQVSPALGAYCGRELEVELSAWTAELAGGARQAPWEERAVRMRGLLEDFFLRRGSGNAAPVVLATLELGGRLAASAAEAELVEKAPAEITAPLLRAAASITSAASATFGDAALRELDTAAVAAAFRLALRALAQLQHLSKQASAAVRPAVAPVLLELPPLLARMMDALDAPVQLVAWVRVAAELLEERSQLDWVACGDQAAVRRWALRFCGRCVDRCIPLLKPGGTEFPAWEVFSEIARLHDRKGSLACEADWNEDCDAWCRTLESAVHVVSKYYPEQAREFLLLVRCTGSPLPAFLEGISIEA